MSRPETLLLVDDSESILYRLEEIAKPIGYGSILTAKTFDEAFRMMAISQRLILDLMLSVEGTEGTRLAGHYIKELGGAPANVAIHSVSFTDSGSYSREETLLRQVILGKVPGVTLIPKLNRPMIDAFLRRDE